MKKMPSVNQRHRGVPRRCRLQIPEGWGLLLETGYSGETVFRPMKLAPEGGWEPIAGEEDAPLEFASQKKALAFLRKQPPITLSEFMGILGVPVLQVVK